MDITDSKDISPPPSFHSQSHSHSHSQSSTHKMEYLPTLDTVNTTTLPHNPHPSINVNQNTNTTSDVEHAQTRENEAPQDTAVTVTGFRARLRAHPRPFAILAALFFLLIVSLVGLVLYMVLVPNAFAGAMATVNALFILFVILVFALMFRQAMVLHQLFNPPSYKSSRLLTSLTGLPTYREATRRSFPESVRGELPGYGHTRGSELLAKTSRGDSGQTQLQRARNRETITEMFT